MLFGPVQIYACPHCSNLHQVQTLASGNTFGAMIYSDGNMFAPMLPRVPKITSCASCKQFFRLNKSNFYDAYDLNETPEEAFEKASGVSFLTYDELLAVLNGDFCSDDDEVFYIRQNLWWLMNQKVANDKVFAADDSHMACYEENCIGLLSMIEDVQDVYLNATQVELLRNLGRFEDALDMLETLPDDEFASFKAAQKERCRAKDRLVFRIDN